MKANHQKNIYVECKAYAPDKKIESDVIKNLRGIRGLEGFAEDVWLITTSDLGKQAKGLADQILNGNEGKYFTFITPVELVDLLVSASIIKVADTCAKEIESIIKNKRQISQPTLLITTFGYFWCYEHMPNGTKTGYVFFDAESADVITNAPLLDKLAEISELDGNMDFSTILSLLDDEKASRLSTDKIALSPSYLEKIDTMKFRILHAGKDELKNSDVFIYPELRKNGDKEERVNAKDIVGKERPEGVLLFGDDLSGKTTLLQRYQVQLAASDSVPILINAQDINVKTLDAFNKLLVENFKKQYNDSSEYAKFFTALVETQPNKITLLVDDLQNISVKRFEDQCSLVSAVTDRYRRAIFVVHRASELEVLTKSEWKEIFSNYSQFNIVQLGHTQRDQLIERWLKASDEDLDDTELLNEKTEIAVKINLAIGKSFVPTYPFYLLTMLQMLTSRSKSSIKGTAYGELYSYLITNALGGAGARPEDVDFYNTYLSCLAYQLFKDDKASIDLISLEKFYSDYLEKMYIEKEFSQVHKLLLRAKLLTEKNGGYSFQFNYIAYYFVAKFLSDNQEITQNEGWIEILTKNLYRDKYANVVIFLIHHSKNPELIEAILAEAKLLFQGVSANMLSAEELTKFNSLITEQVSLTYKDTDVAENRKNELKRRDEIENTSDPTSEEINEKLDLFSKIKYSFRLMEVLGQIANNYYGSLDGKVKTDILEELYGLSLQGMNALLQEYEEYIDGLRDEVKQVLAEKRDKVADVDKLASDITYSFTQLIVFAFIKKASDSVMSKDLLPVVDKLPTTQDQYARHLITTAIKLNFPDELNNIKENVIDLFKQLEKNYLPRDVLRFLVLSHLYKYKVGYVLKQSICDNLEMKLVQPKTPLLT